MAEGAAFLFWLTMSALLQTSKGNYCGGKDCGRRPCCLDDGYKHVCCVHGVRDGLPWWFWLALFGGIALFALLACYKVSRRNRWRRRYMIIRPATVVPAYGTYAEEAAPVLTGTHWQQPPPYTVASQMGQPPSYNPNKH